MRTDPQLTLKEIQNSVNIAELLSKEELSIISREVVSGYEVDDGSRAEWKDLVSKAMAIAKQTIEPNNKQIPQTKDTLCFWTSCFISILLIESCRTGCARRNITRCYFPKSGGFHPPGTIYNVSSSFINPSNNDHPHVVA